MPRTKRPVRKQEKCSEDDDTLKRLTKLVQQKKDNVEAHARNEQMNIELAFKVLLASISSSHLDKTLGQLKTESQQKETQARRSNTRKVSRAASHDDGYLTENSSQGSGGKGATKLMAPPSLSKTVRRSRSADSRVRATPMSRPQRRRSRSVYRTPAYNKAAPSTLPPITPKVNPQVPLTLLRQPRQGEMVVSMSGSPVMVPSCYALQPEEKANCNILLTDGTMLSLQPKKLRESQAYIPFSLMNNNVLTQLKTLKDSLDQMVKLGEKVITK
ncbi:uncharacterized protein LOC121732578 [Aricia agestis]|uniref:uncharacterized protein LOC121732578 n=1 Tax=Aricia agestis TaxID=91739 RepID=UPI001C20BABC|nr:uncharacterized protein LOC121732578 [Aricia agestis]